MLLLCTEKMLRLLLTISIGLSLEVFIEAQFCRDNLRNCPFWKSSCGTNRYVKRNCQKSCGLCVQNPSTACVNKDRRCVQWARNYACQKNYQYMKINCPLACNFCRITTCIDENRSCYTWARNGECRRNPGYMHKKCRKSCQLCGGTKPTKAVTKPTTTTKRPTTTTKRPTTSPKPDSSCIDKHKLCDAWSKDDECKKNPRYMHVNCRKSCRLCGGPKPTPRKTTASKKTLPPHVKERLKCGINRYNHPFVKFVVGGENSNREEWVWQIAMYKNDEFSCGGTLIAPQYVLTAAHCLNDGFQDVDKSVIDIVLGDHTRNEKDKGEQKFKVERFWVHSEYGDINKLNMNADIALIKLDRPATLTKQVGIACLPEANRDVDLNASCYISGWGKMNADGTTVNVLQDAKLPIVSNEVCGKHNTDYRGKSMINENMLCAGSVTKNIGGCNGDSGGPFVCKNKRGQWVVEGAVSWGSSQCDSRLMYTVFARVSKYLDWIKDRIQ